MTTHTIMSSKNEFDTYQAGDTWILKSGDSIDTGDAIGIQQKFDNTILTINGSVLAASLGINNEGSNGLITVGDKGEVSSYGSAIKLFGDNSSLENSGQLAASGFNTVLVGDGTHAITNSGRIFNGVNDGLAFAGSNPAAISHGSFENSGFVNAPRCVVLENSDATVVNTADGLIKGAYDGIVTANYADISVLIKNFGEIDSGIAILGSDGKEKIINSGSIVGDILTHAGEDSLIMKAGGSVNGNVDLGDDSDRLDLRQGDFSHGVVTGGLDDDLYIVGAKDVHITELGGAGSGVDTVKSTASFHLGDNFEDLVLMGGNDISGIGSGDDNWLYGNKGDNHLSGRGGEDVLLGRTGDDLLTGGDDADLFIFSKGYGHDTITDFTQGADRIYLHDISGIGSFKNILDHASQHGTDVELHFGQGEVLTIEDADLAKLTHADFIY